MEKRIPDKVKCIKSMSTGYTVDIVYEVAKNGFVQGPEAMAKWDNTTAHQSKFEPIWESEYQCNPIPHGATKLRLVKDLTKKDVGYKLPALIPKGSITWVKWSSSLVENRIGTSEHVHIEHNRYGANIPGTYFEIVEEDESLPLDVIKEGDWVVVLESDQCYSNCEQGKAQMVNRIDNTCVSLKFSNGLTNTYKKMRCATQGEIDSVKPEATFKTGDWVVVTERHCDNDSIPGHIVMLTDLDEDSKVPYQVKDESDSYGGYSYDWCVDVRMATDEEIESVTEPKEDVKLDDQGRALKTFNVGSWYKTNSHSSADYIRILRVEVYSSYNRVYYDRIINDGVASEKEDYIANSDMDQDMVKVNYCDIPLAEDPFIDYNPTTTRVKAKFKVGDVVNEIEGGFYFCDLESRVAMTSCYSFASGDIRTIHSVTFSEMHQNWWYQFHAHSNYQSECSIALHKEEPVSEPIRPTVTHQFRVGDVVTYSDEISTVLGLCDKSEQYLIAREGGWRSSRIQLDSMSIPIGTLCWSVYESEIKLAESKDHSLEGGSDFDGELLLDLLGKPKEKKRSITSIPVLELIDISTIK